MADFITNKFNTDYTDTCRFTYHFLWNRFGYNARITMFWEMLRVAVGKDEEFDILDYRQIQNGTFNSWLIDRQIEWQEGKDVNFSEIYRSFLIAGDFTGSEKLLFETCDIEERLWAMYLVVTSPGLQL